MFDTDEFYRESCERGFVKVEAVARNVAWTTATDWGDLQITINLSKPEKDPRAIAAGTADAAEGGYVDPATGTKRPCPLCVTERDVEIGYARRIEVGGEPWGMWYSPYAYYTEHCIAMSWQHRPMHIDRAAFSALLDFVDLFPHYFIGSNADLPVVGGSILGHDHFQGGRHAFPMEAAPVVERFEVAGAAGVEAGIVKWPLSVIRLRSDSRADLLDAACRVLDAWRGWSDPAAGVVPYSGEGTGCVRHNTVTPIVRRRGRAGGADGAGDARRGADGAGGAYEMDLALRCNITSAEHPLGVFHPHEELHHIKKENIGLIEVMGLAILPPRVQRVMEERGMTRDDVGRTFATVLEHAGVFKWDDSGRAAFRRFADALQK